MGSWVRPNWHWLFFMCGAGVKRDPGRALMWLEIAAAKGQKVPGAIREYVAKALKPAEREKAEKLAREWLSLHVKP